MEKVECFNSEYQFAFHERLRERSIQYKIIGVQLCASVSTSHVHCAVGGKCVFTVGSV